MFEESIKPHWNKVMKIPGCLMMRFHSQNSRVTGSVVATHHPTNFINGDKKFDLVATALKQCMGKIKIEKN